MYVKISTTIKLRSDNMNFEWYELILIGTVSLFAGFIQRVSGFGLGIFAMMFFPYLMPTYTAATVSGLLSVGQTSYNTVKYRKKICLKTVLPLLVSALVTIPFAVYFSSYVPKVIFKRILGAVLIIMSIFFLFLKERIKIKASVPTGIGSGLLGGALSGLFSTGGPPAVLYLSSALDDKDEFFGSIQFYFAITGIYTAVMRAISGAVTLQVLQLFAIGLVLCFIGNYIGKLVFDKLNSAKIKIIVYIFMAISGLVMILDNLA